MDLGGAGEWIKALVLFGAGCGVVVAFFKWLRPKWREVKYVVVAGRDTLVGRDAVIDSITGKEISPAILGVGTRMANQEQQLNLLTGAVSELAIASRRLDDLDRRVTAIESGAFLERIAGKAEQIQLWQTLQAVAQADPPPDPPDHP